ncbi:MAG TPA: hypothetical protein VMT46_10870 [Anaerolineaceae bacterium]|nr:hypothetical protein [Anaerolineaceae bacterium]
MQFFTFSWGNNYIAIRGLLRALGHELATPGEVSLSTVQKGTQLTHPFLCYSGKIVVGQVAEQIEAGQRNFIFLSSHGAEACRCADTAGFMEMLFREKYPDFRANRLGGNHSAETLATMRQAFPGVSRRQHDAAYFIFGMKLELLYWIGRVCLRLRSLAENADEVRRLEKRMVERVDRHNHPASLFCLGLLFRWKASRIRRKQEQPGIRVGIVGGEHILSELDAIMAKIKDLAEKGVYIEWRSGFRMLARSAAYDNPLPGKEGLAYMKALSRPYLHAHSQSSETISCAHALEFANEGFDGIIHVYAMGCMPQTSLRPALQKISLDRDIPILALSIGDKFNEGGVETRLDAFIDLLRQKREQKEIGACAQPLVAG